MKKVLSKAGKKRIKITALAAAAVLFAGFVLYSSYGSYRLRRLEAMTFEEMVVYTTKGSSTAVITVGIMKNNEAVYTLYGKNGKELPQREHVYEIGSITKTFTASLLCKAVEKGKISLSDPIDKYLDLPAKDYYPTIGRLVTHTSGYKPYYFERPMISNFLNGDNDFYRISKPMLLERIGKIDLEDRDYSFCYSNFGIAALGLVLEKVYGEDYTSLMNTYTRNELGLLHTQISDGNGDMDNYWAWAEGDAYMPAGALTSDISDMLKYAGMQLQNKPEYLAMSHDALAEINISPGVNEAMGIHLDSVGVSWIIDDENNIIWHNGGTDNYNSYIGFSPESGTAVVVLSNLPPDVRIPATVMGIELLTSLQE